MTQEQKELLLKDLCARLPYGVKVCNEGDVFDIDYISPIYGEVHLDIIDNYTIDVSEVKPYLFPMSSMTDEQKHELMGTCTFLRDFAFGWTDRTFDWLNENHFDYRDLIPMGLANDATGLNIY